VLSLQWCPDPKARLALKARLETVAQANTPGFRQLHKVFLPDAGAGWLDFVKQAWVPDGTAAADSAQIAELKEMLSEAPHNQREILDILNHSMREKALQRS
jgi:hypothetical protein